jgi:hypothetical protein
MSRGTEPLRAALFPFELAGERTGERWISLAHPVDRPGECPPCCGGLALRVRAVEERVKKQSD